jgi:hypothetical protein
MNSVREFEIISVVDHRCVYSISRLIGKRIAYRANERGGNI